MAKAIYLQFKFVLLWTISHSKILTTIYFTFSSHYRLEQRALVRGLLTHIRHAKGNASIYLLRRNIHRIEKGLLMPNRHPLFAVEYIGETVKYYIKCLEHSPKGTMDGELKWAKSVLQEYFLSVSNHPYVATAHKIFIAITSDASGDRVPYKRGNATTATTYDALLALAKQRKSVRTFLPKPVPRVLVDKALKIANQAPSNCNRQPMRYHIYDKGALLEKMRHLPLGTAGFADNIPMICALTGDHSAFSYERDRHGFYIDGSLSAMLFMLALETVGLASCPLNWAEINSRNRQFEKLSGLPSHERPIMFIAIGYPDPDGKVAYSERKSLEDLRIFNIESPKGSK